MAGFDNDYFSGKTVNKGYTARMIASYKKKEEEEEEAKSYAEELKKENVKQGKNEDGSKKPDKNLLEIGGDIGKNVGNFVKDAAVDTYKAGERTFTGIKDTIEAEGVRQKMDANSKELQKNTKEWNDYMNSILGDAEDADANPEVRAKWDSPEVQEKFKEYSYKAKLLMGQEIKPEDIPKSALKAAEDAAISKNKAGTQGFEVDPKTGMVKMNVNTIQEDPYEKLKSMAINKEDRKNFDEAQDIDARKLAVDSAETFLNVATLGVGTGIKAGGKALIKKGITEIAEQGAKQGVKTAVKAGTKAGVDAAIGKSGKELAKKAAYDGAIGGAYGVTTTLRQAQEEGKDWGDLGLSDYAGNVLLGVGIGAGIPVAGKGAQVVKKGLVAGDKAAGRAVESTLTKPKSAAELIAEDTAMRTTLRQIGEDGIVGTLDKLVAKGIRKGGYATEDLLAKSRPGQAVLSLRDDFASKWISSFSPLYQTLKRSDFEGRTEGAYLAAREAIGNSNRALSYATRYMEADPDMQQLTATLAVAKDRKVSVKDFDEYAAVKSDLDLVAAGKKVFSKEKMDELNGRMEKFGGEWEDSYKNLAGFYKNLNEFKVENGLMTRAEADAFAEEPFDYIRQQREIPQWLQDRNAKRGGEGSKASISGSDLKQKRNKYASGKVLSPMETAVKTAQLAHTEAYRNKAAKTVYSLLEEAGESKLLRTTDMVKEKNDLLMNLHDTKPVMQKLQKTVRTSQKQINRLYNELDRLNQKGLNIRLKDEGNQPMPNFTPAGLGGDVPTSQAGQVVKEATDPDTDLIQQLMSSTKRTEKSQARADSKSLTQGERDARAKRLAKDKAVSDGTRQDVIAEGAGVNAETNASKLGKTDTEAFLRNLVSQSPDGMKRIRNMIESRDEKLAPLLDSIELMQKDLHDLYEGRQSTWKAAQLIKTGVDKSKQTTMSFLDEGVENVAKIDPEIARALHSWDKQQMNVMNSVLRLSNNVFKYGTTGANAAFALPNFVADQVSSAINSKNVFATHNPLNFVNALMTSLGKPLNADELARFQRFQAGNVGQTTVNQYTKPATGRRMVQDMVKGSGDATPLADYTKFPGKLGEDIKEATQRGAKNLYTNIKHPSEGMRALFDVTEKAVGFTENLTRYQNFRGIEKNAIKKGRDLTDATRLANQAARENSVDFLEMGEYGRVVNSLLPYFNAAIQGNRTLARNLSEKPVSFAAKTTAIVGVPLAATTIWNTGSEERRNIYNTIPDYVKDTNYIVITPGASWNETEKKWDGVILMKKPLGYKEFAEPVRKFIEAQAEDGQDLTGFLKEEGGSIAGDFAQAFSPVDFSSPEKFLSSVTPQLMKPTAQAILNRNFFMERDIVPENLIEENPDDPSAQKYDQYSQLTSAIAAQFNTSPLKVDSWIRDTFGEVGTNAVNSIDELSGAPDEAVGGRSLAESVERRFSGAPGGEDKTAFYEAYLPANNARKAASSQVTELIKAGRVNEAKRRADEYNESLEQRFSKFMDKYSDTPNYDPEWDEKINTLPIKLTKQSIAARKRAD